MQFFLLKGVKLEFNLELAELETPKRHSGGNWLGECVGQRRVWLNVYIWEGQMEPQHWVRAQRKGKCRCSWLWGRPLSFSRWAEKNSRMPQGGWSAASLRLPGKIFQIFNLHCASDSLRECVPNQELWRKEMRNGSLLSVILILCVNLPGLKDAHKAGKHYFWVCL